MNTITSNEASLEFDLNNSDNKVFFTEFRGRFSCHETGQKTCSVTISNGTTYVLNSDETTVDGEELSSGRELAIKLSGYKPFSDGGANVSSGVQIINVTEMVDTDWIQDDRLKGAKEINLIIMQGMVMEPPFDFDPIAGTITLENQPGDKLTIIFTK